MRHSQTKSDANSGHCNREKFQQKNFVRIAFSVVCRQRMCRSVKWKRKKWEMCRVWHETGKPPTSTTQRQFNHSKSIVAKNGRCGMIWASSSATRRFIQLFLTDCPLCRFAIRRTSEKKSTFLFPPSLFCHSKVNYVNFNVELNDIFRLNSNDVNVSSDLNLSIAAETCKWWYRSNKSHRMGFQSPLVVDVHYHLNSTSTDIATNRRTERE